MESSKKWNDLAIKTILAANDVNITEVNNFEPIKSLLFEQEKYPEIVLLIKTKNFDALAQIEFKGKIEFGEYLDIIKFSDQNNKSYIATIYDNDELWQDPQLIDTIEF